MCRLCTILCALLGLTGSPFVWGQTGSTVIIDREYEIKAKYLYYLAIFIKPVEQPEDLSKPVRIAVIGQPGAKFDEVIQQPQFRTIKHPAGPQPIEWTTLNSVMEFKARFPLGQPLPRIVFLANRTTGDKLDAEVAALTGLVLNSPTLIVTEDNQKFRQAVAVNFFEDQAANRVRMQVREASLNERHLAAVPEFLKSPAVLKD